MSSDKTMTPDQVLECSLARVVINGYVFEKEYQTASTILAKNSGIGRMIVLMLAKQFPGYIYYQCNYKNFDAADFNLKGFGGSSAVIGKFLLPHVRTKKVGIIVAANASIHAEILKMQEPVLSEALFRIMDISGAIRPAASPQNVESEQQPPSGTQIPDNFPNQGLASDNTRSSQLHRETLFRRFLRWISGRSK